jgi:hypothetical protein
MKCNGEINGEIFATEWKRISSAVPFSLSSLSEYMVSVKQVNTFEILQYVIRRNIVFRFTGVFISSE